MYNVIGSHNFNRFELTHIPTVPYLTDFLRNVLTFLNLRKKQVDNANKIFLKLAKYMCICNSLQMTED